MYPYNGRHTAEQQQRPTMAFAIRHSIPMVFCCSLYLLCTIIRGIGSDIGCIKCALRLCCAHNTHSPSWSYRCRVASCTRHSCERCAVCIDWIRAAQRLALSSHLAKRCDAWEMRSSESGTIFLLSFSCARTKYGGATLFTSFELFRWFSFPIYIAWQMRTPQKWASSDSR